MEKKTTCSKCGGVLPQASGMNGICPRCLLVLGLGAKEEERQRLGPYEIIEEIGRGGMGVIYKAFQPSLNRVVALKVLADHLCDDNAFVQRFEREAKAAAQLNSPHVVTVYDTGESDGKRFIAMEYVQGQPLSAFIKEHGQVDVAAALRITRQVLWALGAAHSIGIVHRDIKPQNILLNRAHYVKVADFGLAKTHADSLHLTSSGVALGTVGYMAPEQCEGRELDHRVDIYALGVMLYEMLTGQEPFRAATWAEAIYKTLHEAPPSIGALNTSVPAGVQQLVYKAMAKKPEERFQSALDMDKQIRGILKYYETSQRTTPASETQSQRAPQSLVSFRSEAAIPQAQPKSLKWRRVILVCFALIVCVSGAMYLSRLATSKHESLSDGPQAISDSPTTAENDESAPLAPEPQIPIGTPVFIDASVEEAVRRAVGNLSETLSPENLAPPNLYKVDARAKGVTSVEGLQWCTGIIELDLAENKITDVGPLAPLTSLRELQIWDNAIGDFTPLAGLKSLEVLGVENNLNPDIAPIGSLTSLREINLGRNRINDVTPLRSLRQLQILNLRGNAINDLTPLSNLTELRELVLHDNAVTDVGPLSSLSRLGVLYINNNRITDLSPIAGLESLHFLDVGGQNIQSIEPLSNLRNLRELGMGMANVQSLTPLNSLEKLEVLVAGRNPLRVLPDFGRLTNLRVLYLDNSELTSVTGLAALTKLEEVHLDVNRITDISPLAGLPSLKWLGVRENPLSRESRDTIIPSLTARGVKVEYTASGS